MWKTISEYAAMTGLCCTTIHRKITSGKLKGKKEKNRWMVLVEENHAEGSSSEETEEASKVAYHTALENRWGVENALKLSKIENIRADILLKKQKVVEYRERLRVEFCEGVLEAYTNSFSELKAIVVDLKLKKEQIAKFKSAYAKCLKKFEKELESYLKKKDKNEEGDENEPVA